MGPFSRPNSELFCKIFELNKLFYFFRTIGHGSKDEGWVWERRVKIQQNDSELCRWVLEGVIEELKSKQGVDGLK